MRCKHCRRILIPDDQLPGMWMLTESDYLNDDQAFHTACEENNNHPHELSESSNVEDIMKLYHEV